MDFKFRQRVKVKKAPGLILRPKGVPSQAEFFEGSEGIVIRHDPDKGGYLIVLDCPEVSSAMGETITAYFNDYELEQAPPKPTGIAWPVPEHAQDGPFEYRSEPMTGYQTTKAKANRAKRLGDV